MVENPYVHLFVLVKSIIPPGGYRKRKMLSEPNRFIESPLDGNGVYRIVKKYGAQVGLAPEDLGGHSLRAGCATYLLDKEVPPAAVQKQLRHKRFNPTQQYNRGETGKALVGDY